MCRARLRAAPKPRPALPPRVDLKNHLPHRRTWSFCLNNYPNQPPQLPPGGYNPFNPYGGYDPSADYVPWLPGRQSPRFLPLAMIVIAILLCSCCAFFAGTIFGIELPGLLGVDASSGQPQQGPQDEQPTEEPTPESFQYRVVYGNF